jgi:hypothetical protein
MSLAVGESTWGAFCDGEMMTGGAEGPTPLIAAMRAYVASKYGETVDLP